MKVSGKVFVVTGAGSGLGRELARLLIARGASVAGVDLNGNALQETAVALDGERFAPFTADVTNRERVEALPEQVVERFGAVDGVINNAGIIQPFRRLQDLDHAAIERVLQVNLWGTLHMTKAFLPHLLARPEAHLVNVSSMGGFVPVPGQTAYCASKAAVKVLTEGLAAELMDTRVRVSVVCPGAIATNIRENSEAGGGQAAQQTPGNGHRALASADAAEIVVRGIERDAARIFVGRDATLMDLLYRLSPGFAARAIAKKMRGLLTTTG